VKSWMLVAASVQVGQSARVVKKVVVCTSVSSNSISCKDGETFRGMNVGGRPCLVMLVHFVLHSLNLVFGTPRCDTASLSHTAAAAAVAVLFPDTLYHTTISKRSKTSNCYIMTFKGKISCKAINRIRSHGHHNNDDRGARTHADGT
jgi:hypothetical protein